ncbi:DUF3148 domain-containing protein [Chamaesiphon sp. GL140_3_metabinner_50]|uniref:DUF3148 domain-containing protein n=1 Tax=Chamaesiphon sp. GL140_3_metabinner_50 TaxID=2970812 RepID=UPI0025FEB599|nr:DUF3148 domain-containing protein [Chamaesiphon sp. GL140_3_metabinner_50]
MSKKINIGTNIRIIELPTYLKTADPMPTLRSPSLLELGAIGQIIDRKPGNYWVVKFDLHTFLLEERYLEAIDE